MVSKTGCNKGHCCLLQTSKWQKEGHIPCFRGKAGVESGILGYQTRLFDLSTTCLVVSKRDSYVKAFKVLKII